MEASCSSATVTARRSRYGFQVGDSSPQHGDSELSPSAAETRRGFFFLITTGYGCGGGRDQRGSCWRRNSRHEAGNDFPARLQKVRRGAAPCSKAQPDTAHHRLAQECVSCQSLAGSKRQGARAWLDCLVQLASVGVETFPEQTFHITPGARIPFVKCPMSPLCDGTSLQWQWSASMA